MRQRKQFVRINQFVRVPEVRLVTEEGEMLGVKPISEALKMAEESGLDLIEVAPTAKPPVCKLGNFSKYLYEKEKKTKESRKHQGGGQVKEIRFRTRIGEHDFNTKIARIDDFLKHRHKVRVTMVFFGREMQHRDIGEKMVDRIREAVKEVGTVESSPQMYGNRMITILVPNK